ncbi:MAG TPA: FAD-binding oxidoreductase [Paucimonas sp.]|nr:FAD-binding oxidoreductase [Paucimonas sp.]
MAETPNPSRRRLLQAGALVMGATGAGLLPAGALAKPAFLPGGKGLAALGKDLRGRLILPGQQGYAMAAWPNNARWADVHPLAVAMCADDRDVQRCIAWVRDHRVPFVIRSGGHNYAGFSTTPGLLIDVKAINGVQLDLKNGIAVVQGGANNQDVATALRAYNFAIPSGRCPTVGTSGLTLGGGWGFAATHSGLTCDSLLATDVVLANAEKRTIDGQDDLFWAVRGGGGGNFGVHTSFTFKLREVHDVTTFNIVWPPGKQVELLSALQSIQLANARTISTRSKARPLNAGPHPRRDQLLVETLGLYWGNAKELRDILAPAFALLKPQSADIYEMDYWRARDYLLTDDPTGMYDIKCSYVKQALGEEALDTMLTWMTRWPGGSLRQDNMGILFAIGGAVQDVGRDQTAYVHRDSNYIFEMEASWAPIDKPDVVRRQQEWLANYYADMQRFVLPESYVNFPNRDLKNWAQAYYGSNLPRLSQIKRKYDPHNLFKFAQSIPLDV